MSQWTHVNGNIRYDSMAHAGSTIGGNKTEEEHAVEKAARCEQIDLIFFQEIKEILGEMIGYEHVGLFGEDGGNCPQSHIPCGSEGSIEYEAIKCDRGYNVIIWGDLRNYGDSDTKKEIFPWFEKVIAGELTDLIFVRSAILHVQVEYGNDYIILRDDDSIGDKDRPRTIVHDLGKKNRKLQI